MTSFACRNAVFAAAILALASAATSAAQAQEVTDTQSAQAYFNRLDQYKKGSFTLADMQRIETKMFRLADANQDGKLSLDEYVAGIPASRPDVLKRYTRRFHLSDRNQDGYVSLDEYMAFCARVVELADTNKDGVVTREEFMALAGSGGQ